LSRITGTGIIIRDRERRIVAVNKVYLDFLGYTREELETLPPYSYTDSENREETQRQFARLQRGEISRYQLERRYVHKNGQKRWADVAVSAIRDADNQFAASITSVSDIEDRKVAEEELKRANFLSDQALALTTSGYWHAPLDGSGWYNSSKRSVEIFGDVPNENLRYRVKEDGSPASRRSIRKSPG
jgi:PAS domain S-box-containing protein